MISLHNYSHSLSISLNNSVQCYVFSIASHITIVIWDISLNTFSVVHLSPCGNTLHPYNRIKMNMRKFIILNITSHISLSNSYIKYIKWSIIHIFKLSLAHSHVCVYKMMYINSSVKKNITRRFYIMDWWSIWYNRREYISQRWQ